MVSNRKAEGSLLRVFIYEGQHTAPTLVLPSLRGMKPEPAVLEPDDSDIAFGGAAIAARIAEVSKNRRAGVLLVLALDAETVGQKRIATRGIDQKTSAPHLRGTVFEQQIHHRIPAILQAAELHRCHTRAFADTRTFGSAVFSSI